MYSLSLTLSFTPSHSQFSQPTHFGLLRNFLLVFLCVIFMLLLLLPYNIISIKQHTKKKKEERIPLLLRTPRDGNFFWKKAATKANTQKEKQQKEKQRKKIRNDNNLYFIQHSEGKKGKKCEGKKMCSFFAAM